jgi:hypothetical protein
MNPRASGCVQRMEACSEPALRSKQSPTIRALVLVEAFHGACEDLLA